MKTIKPSELSNLACLICIYGMSGVGKTLSSIMSLPKKIAWIVSEPRDFKRTLNEAKLSDNEIDLLTYADLDDLIGFCNKVENFTPYKSVLFDSLSYFMNVEMEAEVMEESYESMSDAAKVEAGLKGRLKLTLPGRGLVNKSIFRLLGLLGKISAYGKIVVITCLEAEHPKWNRVLAGGPALSGREVPDNFPGFFDLIGHVSTKTDKEGKIMYPPVVSFESDGAYLAKGTGLDKKVWPLNFGKILGIKEK